MGVSFFQTNINGITGPVKFDEFGARTDFKLRLLELTREGLKHVGDWTPGKHVTFMSNYTKAMTEIYRDTLKNKTLTVVTLKVSHPETGIWCHFSTFISLRANRTVWR